LLKIFLFFFCAIGSRPAAQPLLGIDRRRQFDVRGSRAGVYQLGMPSRGGAQPNSHDMVGGQRPWPRAQFGLGGAKRGFALAASDALEDSQPQQFPGSSFYTYTQGAARAFGVARHPGDGRRAGRLTAARLSAA
jgi:hypothetical protein